MKFPEFEEELAKARKKFKGGDEGVLKRYAFLNCVLDTEISEPLYRLVSPIYMLFFFEEHPEMEAIMASSETSSREAVCLSVDRLIQTLKRLQKPQ